MTDPAVTPPVTPSAPPPLTGRASTAGRLDEAKRWRGYRSEALTVARASAAKWQGGLAGLLALVTGLSVTSFGTEIRALTEPAGVVTAAFVAVSVSTAVAALLVALSASGGMPKVVRAGEDVDAGEFLAAVSVRKRLLASIWLTCASLLAFAAAVGITWFGPRDPTGTVTVVTPTSGAAVCGSITAVLDDTLYVTDADGRPVTIPLDQVGTIVTDDACP